MSLRDYFAAAALTGFCGNTDLDTREEKAAAFANDAYAFADAMLAERLKTKK
jgi:hypothetical protein